MTLEGRRLLVVGGSAGVGRAVARLAALDGATVAVAARRDAETQEVAEACRATGARARAFFVDTGGGEGPARAVREAVDWAGGLDTVVYSVGQAPLALLEDVAAEAWQRLFATNVVGAAMVVQAALPHLRASAEGGSAVLVSSHIVGAPWKWLGAYAVSKAALDELARALRVEEPHVRFLRVALGDTATGFADNWDADLFGEALMTWFPDGRLPYRVLSADEAARRILDAVADRDGPDDVLVRGEPAD